LRHLIKEMDEVLSGLTLAFLQLERSGKCCHGVTLSQCHALELLLKKGDLTMNELSRQMGLAKSTMTRIVNNMVRGGWIERVKDQGDRRLVNVRLTRKGREMAKTLGVSSQDYIQRILKHIPLGKIPQVVESLKWIVKSLGKEVQMQEVA
jgi:MarR family transcriptional regulator, organic hydroperoxide resistance regulator